MEEELREGTTPDEPDPTPAEVWLNVLPMLVREEADPKGDKAWARGARFMRDRADAALTAQVADAAGRVEAWAGSVKRLLAVAPVDAVINETGIAWRGHSTPPDRAAIRAEAAATVDRWLARDLAALRTALGEDQ